MTLVRTVAAHQVVQATFPRPVTEKDELGIATGRAIDSALSRYSHEFLQGRRPTASAMERFASEELDRELTDADLEVPADVREQVRLQVAGAVRAFRRTELFGLSRPRSRLILIRSEVGIYAQPDYWDGRGRIYEMKSYKADPLPPDVDLQLRLFQLAFPGFLEYLVCIDRHATPVEASVVQIPPIPRERAEETLRIAYRVGREKGTEKVLEYVDSPVVRYELPEEPAGGA